MAKSRNQVKRFSALLAGMLMLAGTSFSSSAMSIKLPEWTSLTLDHEASFRASAMKDKSMWVAGTKGSVYVSQDGGATWQDKSPKLDTQHDFRDIQLFDHQTAIIMSVGSGSDSTLYLTEDGGDTWQPLLINEDETGFFDSIAFWDRDNGLLLGDPVDGFYVIKKTTDGGKSWQRIDEANLPSMLENEAAFAASGYTLIVGESGKAWLTTGGYSASVYESSDYGETWKRHAVPLYAETATAGGYGLTLNHRQQLFVVGGDYTQREKQYPNIAVYKDGTWEKVHSKQRGLRTAIQCLGNICLTVGKNGNDISLNAGKSWQSFQRQHGEEVTGFYTLSADGMVFLAAGTEGKIGIVSFAPKQSSKNRSRLSQ